MTGVADTATSSVTVVRDGTVRAAGLRLRDAVVYDWGFQLDGRSYQQRTFVLLDEGFQVNQPVVFLPQQQGWWYCDLVRITDHGDVIEVDDHWIDIIVGPPDHPYRVLDLDEFGTAVRDGRLSAVDAADGLKQAQCFLDRHLNRRHDVTRAWPDFPPSGIAALRHVTFAPHWSLMDAPH